MPAHTIEKILFFKNRLAQYGVLHHFRESLQKALEDKGIQTSLIDMENFDRRLFLNSIYSSPPDYTFAINGLQPLADGTFLCDYLEIPHIAWLVDSADYYSEFAKSPLNILITPDAQSQNSFNEWGAKQAFFLPHAFDGAQKYRADLPRLLPLVFCGSLMDPIEVEDLWKAYLPAELVNDFIESADLTLLNPVLTYQNAFKAVIKKHSNFFSSLTELQTAKLATTFDSYVRAKDRIHLLKGLEGLPIHIYGNCLSKRSWGDFLNLSGGNYTIHPAVTFNEAFEIMKNAQIVLNSSPMFKTGAHERIFYGLGLGAAVLTNETPWNRTHFSNEELLVYPSMNPSLIYEEIEELLAHPKKLIEIAMKGQKKVIQEHTWDARAAQLIERLENCGLHKEELL